MGTYNKETGLPIDKSYLECGLPPFLEESLKEMKREWALYDSGKMSMRWDCYYCDLQSSINVAEVESLISEEQAWYLREKYLRIERGGF